MTATGPVRRTEVGRVGRQKAVRVIAAVVMVGLAPAMAATSASAADRAPADGLISPTASAQPSPGSTSSAPATASSAASAATGGSTTPATASSAAPAATGGSSASPAAGQSDGTSTSPSPSASVPPAPTGQGLSDNELIVAQLDASGLPTSATIYDQLTAVGLPSRTYQNPTATKDLAYVGQRGAPKVENGDASITVGGDESTVTTQAVFGKPLPIGLHAGYSRMGTAVAPAEVVEADGTMDVTYTVTNTTAKDQSIGYTAADGSAHTDTAPVFAPYVGTLRVEVPSGVRIEDAPGGVVVATPSGATAVTWQLVLYPPLGDYEQKLNLRLTSDRLDIPAIRLEVVPVTDAEDPASSFSSDLLAKSTEGSANLADGLGQLNSSTLELAAGAAELSAGLSELEAGTYELAAGLDEAYAGSAQLSSAIGALSSGANAVAAGLTQLADSADMRAAQLQLAGAADALGRVSALLGAPGQGLPGTAGTPGATLYQLTLAAQQGSAAVAQQTAEVSAQLANLAKVDLPAVTDRVGALQVAANGTAADVAAAFNALCAASPLPPGCDRLQAAQTGVATVQQRAGDVQAAAQDALTRASAAAGTASEAAERASAAAGALAELERSLAAVADALGQGGPSAPGVAANLVGAGQALTAATKALTGLATGATAFAQGFGQLAQGSNELTAGLADAAAGSDQLAAGTTQLSDGADQLAAGARDLQQQGTSKIYSEVVASSEDPAFASAYLAATYKRTTEAMPYGAPEGAVGRAAYVYDLATPANSQPVNWGVVAATALAAIALTIIAVRRIAGPGPGGSAEGAMAGSGPDDPSAALLPEGSLEGTEGPMEGTGAESEQAVASEEETDVDAGPAARAAAPASAGDHDTDPGGTDDEDARQIDEER